MIDGSVDGPLWYKDAVIYELHVRAFHDSDGDGVGDFRGLTTKLDYLADLGVTALWLLPFYPSPLRDDGYDIADYKDVHPAYGTLTDFKEFLHEAHERDLKVITELVINHTSDEHPWFKRAVRAEPGSTERDFYVWSETPEKWEETRVIFSDTEHSNWAWHPRAEAYYWHRFFSHQPDLNFDNPAVMDAVKDVLDFWAGMGVDGMRLDAIPYLVERDGTNCENLPETHEVLAELRAHLDAHHDNRMFLAEANQWPEDASRYFGDGDECHMNFHFPLMPRLFMSVRMEDRFPIIDILQQTPEIPDNCQWAVFLRNHDELTLEMVTDEERDYMYRAYAHEQRMRVNVGIRRRLAPLLGNNRRLLELLNGLLLSMPGTPVLYYGDEIGMGDNIYLGDRNGVRTPMQWSADRNAGFSRANPQKLYLPTIIDPEYHFETVNVEAQHNNPSSLLWWMKRLIALRKRHPVFGRGSIQFLYPDNPKVLAFVREYDLRGVQDGHPDGDVELERVLVVANLSRFTQAVQLDLSDYQGLTPIEMFGRTPFPAIGELPYFLTLGPHAFHWFAVDQTRDEISLGYRSQELESVEVADRSGEIPVIQAVGDWQDLFRGDNDAFEQVLPRLLANRRWFGAKARQIRSTELVEAISVPVDGGADACELVVVRVAYTEGEPDNYLLPVAFAAGEDAERVCEDIPAAVLASVSWPDAEGRDAVLFDAMWNERFTIRLLELIQAGQTGAGSRQSGDDLGSGSGAAGVGGRIAGTTGELVARPTGAPPGFEEGEDGHDVTVLRAEQSNTSVVYGAKFICKLFRRIEEGDNPDLELSRFLTERTDFAHTPALVGVIELRRRRGEPLTLALLQSFVHNEGDAWTYTIDDLGRYYELALSETHDGGEQRLASPQAGVIELSRQQLPADAHKRIGPYLQSAELLGRRTGQLHVALGSDTESPGFAPEAFTSLYQRSLYQSMRTSTRRTFQLLRGRLADLPDELRPEAERVLEREDALLDRFRTLVGRRLSAERIRTHGDYHLGQVLHTGKDFAIIDFEGEPARPITERRLKRSPLRDVAGMLRSFHYAAYAGLFEQEERGVIGPDTHYADLETWTRYWYVWVTTGFLAGYRQVDGVTRMLPDDEGDLQVMLDAYLLEKAVYEVGYELNNRPGWLRIPLAGITELLDGSATTAT